MLGRLRRFSRWDRRDIRGRSERSMPVPEGIFERIVEHVDPDGEEWLNGLAIPPRPLMTSRSTNTASTSMPDVPGLNLAKAQMSAHTSDEGGRFTEPAAAVSSCSG